MKKLVGWTIAAVLVLIGLWAVSLPFIAGTLDKDIAERARTQVDFPIRLGTGGLECQLVASSTQFTSGDQIRLVGDQAPGAETVIIYVFPRPHIVGSRIIDPYPVYPRFESTASCVSEDLPHLADGDYQAWIHIGSSRAHIDFHVGAT